MAGMKPKHPSGLYVLFFTEMWERFSYYLMVALLYLYIKEPAKVDGSGGMGMSPEEAINIYGAYIALVYLTPYYGGLVADRLLGFRRTVIIGALLMCAGHLCMALPGRPIFFSALLLLILGNGLFKPNISSMVGSLYPEGSPLRDSAYSIFYMGINVGALFGPLVADLMRSGDIPFTKIHVLSHFGWHWSFGSAAIGMCLSAILFILLRRPIEHADIAAQRIALRRSQGHPRSVLPPHLARRARRFWILTAVAAAWSLVSIVAALVPSVGAVVPVLARLRNPLSLVIEGVGAALGQVEVASITVRWTDAFFWGAAIITVLVVAWPRVQVVETTEDASPEVQRQRVGALFIIFGIVVLFWMAFHQNGSTLTSWAEKNTRTSWNPEIFQVFNSTFVVLFTPLVVFFWSRMRRLGREPSTPAKVGLGMVLTAACYGLMATAGLAGGDAGQVSPLWLIGGYAVITLGELCLSPVGLSLVAKLAPQALRGSLMGAWFLATSIGNKLAGDVGEHYWAKLPHSRFFAILVVLCLMAAGVLLVLLPRLRRAMPTEEEVVQTVVAPGGGEPAPARS